MEKIESVTRVQILQEAACISLHTNALQKAMKPSLILPAMGKY